MRELPDTCLEIENSLPLWVGGDLEPVAQRAVDEHLARCARCADRGAKARRARVALREGLRLQVQDGADLALRSDVWGAIRSRLQSEGVLPGGAPVAARRPYRLRRIALAGSLAAAVLLGLLFPWNRVVEPVPGTVPEVRSPQLTGLEATDVAPRTVVGSAVVKPAGLRPLGANERRLRDSAQMFGLPDENMGSQASLERWIGPTPRQ